MKKFMVILAAALAGVIAALLTLPKRDLPRSSNGSNEQVLTKGEAGSAIVDSPEVRIAKRKESLKQITDQVLQLKEDEWLRSWKLTERNGKTLGSEELKGEPYIASFFFSSCPVVCVRQNDQVRLLQEKFKKLPIRLVSITCDPEVDTPEKLAAYAERIGAHPERWLFFTGEWEYLRRVSAEIFLNALHMPREHIEKFLLVDAEGRLVAEYDWHDPEELQVLERDVRAMLSSEVR